MLSIFAKRKGIRALLPNCHNKLGKEEGGGVNCTAPFPLVFKIHVQVVADKN